MDDFELVAWQKAVWKTFPATFTALLNGGDVKLPRSWPGRGRFFSACPWNKGPGTGQRARQSCKRTTPSFSQDTLFVSRLSKPRTPTYSRWVYGAGLSREPQYSLFLSVVNGAELSREPQHILAGCMARGTTMNCPRRGSENPPVFTCVRASACCICLEWTRLRGQKASLTLECFFQQLESQTADALRQRRAARRAR